MAVTDLIFQLKDGRYVANISPSGNVTIDIQQIKSGYISIYAYLQSMDPILIGIINNSISTYLSEEPSKMIFQISVPSGVNIKIVSETQVLSCKILMDV